MSHKSRVVLVDGTWLVFRAFFAIPANFSTKAGVPTNATYGFALMFRKLLAAKKAAFAAVLFDSKEPTAREIQFPAYKVQRPPAPHELIAQLPWIEKLTRTQGFASIRKPGVEADDLIATYTKIALAAGHEVMIVAGDKDLAQLIEDDVRMYDSMREVTFDTELVRKKWGVLPNQIPDYLALVGDSADNFPGVAGIGEKTATQLLTEHGTIDGIYAALATTPNAFKPRVRQALTTHESTARACLQLATLIDDVEGLALEDLTLQTPNAEHISQLYHELEFRSLLSAEPKAASAETAVTWPALATWDELVAWTKGRARVAVAPWTLAHDVTSRHAVRCGHLVFADDASAVSIDLSALRDPVRDFGALDCGLIVYDLKTLVLALLNEKKLRALDVQHFVALPFFDVMLASYLVEPSKLVPHRLGQIEKEYLAETQIGAAPKTLADAALCAQVSCALHPILHERLSELLRSHLQAVEQPLAGVLARMEFDGVACDAHKLQGLEHQFVSARDITEAAIFDLAGQRFNLNSTHQLGEVLFEKLALPVIRKTKTGYSTDAETLEKLAPKHPIANLLLRHRELSKLIQTYTSVLGEALQDNGRIHATFQQTAGVSGRIISTAPDLQRTPVRTAEGKLIRDAFVAPAGRRIIVLDWSQIELRVLAHLSGDERLVSALLAKADLHRQTAAALLNKQATAITKEERDLGKTINFATIYGQGATALGQILGITRKAAEGYIEAYFTLYAGVRSWQHNAILEAKASGFVTTMLGRRRYVEELKSYAAMDQKAGERIAINTMVQGSAADLCKLAMLAIDRAFAADPELANSQLVLQIHDELVIEADASCADRARDVAVAAMMLPELKMRVPLVVEAGIGDSWGSAKH